MDLMTPGLTVAVFNVLLRGLTLVSKFLLVVALARFLAVEDLGVYGLVVSSVAIAVFVLSLEYKYFTMRKLVARQGESWRQAAILRDQAILYGMVSTVVLPLLAFVFLSGAWVPVPVAVVPWFFAIVVAELAAQEASNALIGLSRPIAANIVLFIRSGVWVYPVIVLALVSASTRSIFVVLVAWLLGAVASFAIAAWCLRRLSWRAALSKPVDWGMMRIGLRSAAPFIVTTGAALGLLFFDRFVIDVYWGLDAVGVYVFFAGITTALHSLVNSGVSVIRMPRLVRARHDADLLRFRSELRRMTVATTVSTVLLAIALALGILPLLRLVDKPIYESTLDVFFLLLVAAVIRCLADPPLYALYATHQDMSLLVVNVAAFVAAALANLLLVPSLGLQGAALAAAIGALILLVLAVTVHRRREGSRNWPLAEEPHPVSLPL